MTTSIFRFITLFLCLLTLQSCGVVKSESEVVYSTDVINSATLNGLAPKERVVECQGVTNCIISFPGAEGFGRFSRGGRGGDVYHVTTLNNDGEGSLREGVKNTSGPRTVVFDVSGTIFLKSPLKLNNPYITIAGQTAPGDGITVAGNVFKINTDHVIVRFIRSRLGDALSVESDAINVSKGKHIMIDHSTASWSVDEVLSNKNQAIDLMTLQWSIISESLDRSIHSEGDHGFGGIIGAKRQSYHHNLFAHHRSRFPKITSRWHTKVDYRNNVLYNWGTKASYDGSSTNANWANNYYKAGPATQNRHKNLIFDIHSRNRGTDSAKFPTKFYIKGNVVEGNDEISNDNWAGGVKFSNGASQDSTRVLTAFNYPLISESNAQQAYDDVLTFSGASLARDSVDTRIINEVRGGYATYGRSGIIDSQTDVGGWPILKSLPAPLDTDQDGMPDEWEKFHGLNYKNPEDRNVDLYSDGYTALELYLNELVETTYPKENSR